MAIPPTPPTPPARRPASPQDDSQGPCGGSMAALIITAVLHALLTAGTLLLVGLLMLAALLGTGTAGAVGAVLLLGALLAGAHWALLECLRMAGLPHPGATAALLTVSVVLALAQAAITVFAFNAGSLAAAPFAAAFQGAAVATVLAVSRKHALGWACAAVVGVVLAHALLALTTA